MSYLAQIYIELKDIYCTRHPDRYLGGSRFLEIVMSISVWQVLVKMCSTRERLHTQKLDKKKLSFFLVPNIYAKHQLELKNKDLIKVQKLWKHKYIAVSCENLIFLPVTLITYFI